MYTLYTVYYARDTYTYIFICFRFLEYKRDSMGYTSGYAKASIYIYIHYTYTYSHLQGILYPIINEHIQFDIITPVDSLSQQT